MSQASIILRSAVGVLNEGGWTRGRYGLLSREGHHCAVGAIRVACWEKADGNESKYMRLQREVTRLLAKCIDSTEPLYAAERRVVFWNDMPGRSASQVIGKMTDCADEEEAREQAES